MLLRHACIPISPYWHITGTLVVPTSVLKPPAPTTATRIRTIPFGVGYSTEHLTRWVGVSPTTISRRYIALKKYCCFKTADERHIIRLSLYCLWSTLQLNKLLYRFYLRRTLKFKTSVSLFKTYKLRSLGQSTSRRASTLNASSTSGIPPRLTLISLCPTSIFRRCDIGLTYARDSLGCPQGLPTYKINPLQFTIQYAVTRTP